MRALTAGSMGPSGVKRADCSMLEQGVIEVGLARAAQVLAVGAVDVFLKCGGLETRGLEARGEQHDISAQTIVRVGAL